MAEKLPRSLKNLDLNTNREPKNKILVSAYLSSLRMSPLKSKPPSLVSLCLGVIGKHLEEMIPCLADISVIFPADIKMSIAAIARRRKLLDDDVIISLADSSWKILDVSGSDVTNSGLAKVAEMCKSLPLTDKPRVDKDSLEMLSSECPRIMVNPKPSLVSYRADVVPQEALPDVALDEPFVKDIDPKTWVVTGVVQNACLFSTVVVMNQFTAVFGRKIRTVAGYRKVFVTV